MNTRNNFYKCTIIVVSIALIAGLGSLFVNLGLDWFASLEKPSKFIPAFIIPIVWSIIYVSYAVILCLWQKNDDFSTKTLVLLILNGILNILWCLLFFTFNNTLLGLIAIIFNLILSILLTLNIYKKFPIYGYVLSISPIWLSLATTLNLATWILN